MQEATKTNRNDSIGHLKKPPTIEYHPVQEEDEFVIEDEGAPDK